MLGIAPGKAALDAAMPAIGLAIFPWHHADNLFAAHFGPERAANAAIGAGGDDARSGVPISDRLFLDQRRGRAGLHTGTAGHAFAAKEIVGACPAEIFEAKPRPPWSAPACLAPRHRPARSANRRCIWTDQNRNRDWNVLGLAQMVPAVIVITHIAQADRPGLILQFAIVIGAACQAIERVIGNIEFHHPLPQILPDAAFGCGPPCPASAGVVQLAGVPAPVNFDKAQSA